jgi:hypothetical protein
MVARGTATVVLASWDRNASIGRWVPQSLGVGATDVGGGRIARGGRFCSGGVRARRDGLERLGADREMLERGHVRLVSAWSAVISAHKNPASSRPTATATTDRTLLRAASFVEPGRQADVCVPGSRDDVGSDAVMAGSDAGTNVGPMLVCPGGLDELRTEVTVAGVGDVTAMFTRTGRVLRGDQPGAGHERPGGGEPRPVEPLGGQAQPAGAGDAPIGGEAMGRFTERRRIAVGHETTLDPGEARVAARDGGAVVRERRRQRSIIETPPGQPSLVLERPVRSVTPYHRVTQQELGEPIPGPGQVLHHVAAEATQIPHRFWGR